MCTTVASLAMVWNNPSDYFVFIEGSSAFLLSLVAHFGAFAGQGLVNIKLENYEKAIMSYEEAMKIYPSMNSPKIMIKQLKELIQKQSI